jgi:hypothetical protein
MTIFLVRHGETEWNRARRYQGWSDSPLTEDGIAQAEAIEPLTGLEFRRGRSHALDLAEKSEVLQDPQTAAVVIATPVASHFDLAVKALEARKNILVEKPMAVNVVTLLVNPNESERLTLAAGEGKIQLALRNPLDSDNPVTPGVRPAGLLGSVPPVRQVAMAAAPRPAGAQPAPAPVVPQPAMVEIIRGDKRAQEVVRQEH